MNTSLAVQNEDDRSNQKRQTPLNDNYLILKVSVNTCLKAIGKTQIALIAITSEICFVNRDEVEVYEFTWRYSTRLWERLNGARN